MILRFSSNIKPCQIYIKIKLFYLNSLVGKVAYFLGRDTGRRGFESYSLQALGIEAMRLH